MSLSVQSKVSVIIPTRNRLDDLLQTLERITADSYREVEILVYDDCSATDPRPALAERFPNVIVFRSDRQSGPCELRNRLIAASSGEIIVGFDDDCAFESRDAFGQIAALFTEWPRLGLLSFRVRAGGTLWPPARGRGMRETAAFISCAFAARREAMAAIGGFDPSIFRQGEERDLAIRLMDAGYEIRHNDDIIADHRESDGERDHQFIHAKALRNELLFVIKRVPAAHAPWRLLRHALGHVRFCMSRQWWRAMAVGFGGFFQDVLPALSQRRAVSIPTWHRFVRLVAAPLDYDAGDPSHSAPWNARPTQ